MKNRRRTDEKTDIKEICKRCSKDELSKRQMKARERTDINKTDEGWEGGQTLGGSEA